MAKLQLLDAYGRPIEKAGLMREAAAATVTGVRNPHAGYPADGLNPQALAVILRQAAENDPLQYFELAELIEERDLHYAGVIGTRKRSVAQIDITVDAASNDKVHESHAELVRAWLKRDELQDELFDILDCISKGVSFVEIMWDASEGQFWPKRLEYRDPRYFTFDRRDWATPLLRDTGNPNGIPLQGGKFIYGRIQAKGGLPIRGGLARMAAWAWMFKAYTQRDWAIFTQTYGQPIRIGKYGAAATKEERDTLYNAVAHIAGDCAAIMPESMSIEFIEAKNITGSTDHYERRANWLDMQVSKGVLGQTTTTDAVAGGHAVSKEHRKVQEDIERADAKALGAILNRDLVRTMVDLNFGPQKAYPRLVIARPEEKDVKLIIEGVERMVPYGLRASKKQMQELLGLKDAEDDDDLLTAPAAAPPAESEVPPPKPGVKTKVENLAASLFASFKPVKTVRTPDAVDGIIEEAAPAMDEATEMLIAHIRAAAEEATSIEDLQRKVLAMVPGLPEGQLAAAMGQALVLANLTGRDQAEAPGLG